MKKIKIYSSIALILGLLLALVSVVVPIIKINEFTEQNGSVGNHRRSRYAHPNRTYERRTRLYGNRVFNEIPHYRCRKAA